MRSFRAELALRFTATMAVGITLVSGLGYLALRASLDRHIDASLIKVASIQAASVTDDPSGAMRFHEWEITPEEAESLRDLARYAQIWNESGESLGRSASLTRDLPLDRAALDESIGGDVAWTNEPFGDGSIRAIYYPLGRMGPDHARHILEVAAPLDVRDDTLRFAALFLAGLVLLVSAGSLAGSWWLADQAIRALEDITARAEGIGAGTPGQRIKVHADTHEFRRLVRVLNTMLGRLDSAFEAQRRFTADASHELRSPLTALRGELELAQRRDRSPEEYRRVIGSALEETERIAALTEDLLTLARADAGVMKPRLQRTDLGERASESLKRLQTQAEDRRQRIELDSVGDVVGLLDPDLVDRLIWNLVDNAIKFSSPGSEIRISVRGSDDELTLVVADTGPGIRDEALDTIFERFSQADSSHSSVEGTGLGLSIVRAIAEAHGGTVTAENRPAGGALFQVRLPRNT